MFSTISQSDAGPLILLYLENWHSVLRLRCNGVSFLPLFAVSIGAVIVGVMSTVTIRHHSLARRNVREEYGQSDDNEKKEVGLQLGVNTQHERGNGQGKEDKRGKTETGRERKRNEDREEHDEMRDTCVLLSNCSAL